MRTVLRDSSRSVVLVRTEYVRLDHEGAVEDRRNWGESPSRRSEYSGFNTTGSRGSGLRRRSSFDLIAPGLSGCSVDRPRPGVERGRDGERIDKGDCMGGALIGLGSSTGRSGEGEGVTWLSIPTGVSSGSSLRA